jgi:RNA-directed DNA polymerase
MGSDFKADDRELISKFTSLREPRDVAGLLEMKYGRLIYLVYKRNPASNFRVFSIRKRSGESRRIDAPIGPLKDVQRKLNYALQLVYAPKLSAHGFILDRSIVTNAQSHVRKSIVFNLDVKDFFPSINFGRVRGMFLGYPFKLPTRVASLLAGICCHNNYLPQGAPTSPIISNMICSKLDSELQGLAKRYRCTYTRYADDMTFSTTARRLSSSIGRIEKTEGGVSVEVGSEVRKIISANGFEINENKVKVRLRTNRQVVTGLTVNRGPNVARAFVRQIRAMLHAWEKYGLEDAEKEYYRLYYSKQHNPMLPLPSFARVVKGKIEFVRMVKGETDLVYRNLANRYFIIREGRRKYYTNPIEEISAALWVLIHEEGESYSQGTAFMLKDVGLVTCQHVLKAKMHAFRHDKPSIKYPISVVAEDKGRDLAILKIDADNPYGLVESKNPSFSYHDKITLAGFPNYFLGHEPYITPAQIVGSRKIFGIEMILMNTPVVWGNSGGPVLNSNNEVIGIAASGADRIDNAERADYNGFIPITNLKYLIGD